MKSKTEYKLSEKEISCLKEALGIADDTKKQIEVFRNHLITNGNDLTLDDLVTNGIIAIVSACGQGRTVGTPKAKLIICDEVTPWTEDQAELLAAAQKKTLTRDGIIVWGTVPSAGKVLMVQGSEKIKVSPTTVNAIHSLSDESIFPIASMKERPFNLSGSFQCTIDPETLAKGSFMAMLHGHEVPNHILNLIGGLDEAVMELARNISERQGMPLDETMHRLWTIMHKEEEWLGDFGVKIRPKWLTRRYRRKKKLRPDQGKKRKRQIEKVDFSRRKFEMYKRASYIGVHKRHNETFESFRTRYFEALFNSKRSGGHAR